MRLFACTKNAFYIYLSNYLSIYPAIYLAIYKPVGARVPKRGNKRPVTSVASFRRLKMKNTVPSSPAVCHVDERVRCHPQQLLPRPYRSLS